MFQTIETEHCRLRCFCEGDLHRFAAYRSDPEVARYQSWSSYGYEDALALYADLSGKPFGLEGEWYQIALADKTTDALVGDLALHCLEPQVAEIGYTIAPGFQGRGFAKEGLRALLAYLFAERGYRRVLANTDSRNLASIGVLKSVGFERAALAPRQVIFKGEPGEELDFVYHAESWRARA